MADPAENRPPQSPQSPETGPDGTQGAGNLEVLARFLPAPVELTERAVYRLGSTAPSTIRAYLTDWTDFRAWCATTGHPPLPATAAAVTGYLTHLASSTDENRAPAVAHTTLQRRTAAIAYAHDLADHPSPTLQPIVGDALRFWAHQHGTAPDRQAKPLTTRLLRQVVDLLPPTRAGARNRALLLIGFAAALRRSEIANLQLGDIEPVDEGLVITIRSSKTDQTGHGEQVGVPYGANPGTCPVRAHTAWLHHRGTSPGTWMCRINRGDRLTTPHAGITGAAVNDIIQAACTGAGLPGGYSGHSLRAGFITAAAENGLPEWAIMTQTRHRSPTTMAGYIRRGSLFRANPAAAVGL